MWAMMIALYEPTLLDVLIILKDEYSFTQGLISHMTFSLNFQFVYKQCSFTPQKIKFGVRVRRNKWSEKKIGRPRNQERPPRNLRNLPRRWRVALALWSKQNPKRSSRSFLPRCYAVLPALWHIRDIHFKC